MSIETDTTPEILEEGQKPSESVRDLKVQAILYETVDQAYEFI